MSEMEQEIRNQLRKFCEDNIEPILEEDDEKEVFRKEIFQKLGELGFTGMNISEDFGGAGLGLVESCVALEEISKYSISYSVTLSVSSMVQAIIQEFGNQEQKHKYLPELTSGHEIGSFALSESSAGSDAAALQCSAKKTDGGYLLNGSKMWITSGSLSKTFVVMARTGQEGPKGISAFIVQKGMEGFSVGKKEKKMGWRSSPTTEIIFENCFVPEENLIGKEGDGLKVAIGGLNKGRISIGAMSLGLAQRALDESVKYSLGRQQFNQPIFDFQGLQFMMADMATEVECSRHLVYYAAKEFDEGRSNIKLSSMAKMKASDTAMKVSTDAVQIFGGVGYTKEYPVERFMRDAKVLQIVEGTNQIQKVVIGRELRKSYE